eukprot:TRINITY_DN60021_c0_g1_i1.p1 TRINITY_DN60021_c0_g1~~TRINITY_DN60021_c0_g1_i1.p1  ORF type:complete len:878 (+),score=169.63 TRINITY_DN60021_c0_g1_i1:77-2710(+)
MRLFRDAVPSDPGGSESSGTEGGPRSEGSSSHAGDPREDLDECSSESDAGSLRSEGGPAGTTMPEGLWSALYSDGAAAMFAVLRSRSGGITYQSMAEADERGLLRPGAALPPPPPPFEPDWADWAGRWGGAQPGAVWLRVASCDPGAEVLLTVSRRRGGKLLRAAAVRVAHGDSMTAPAPRPRPRWQADFTSGTQSASPSRASQRRRFRISQPCSPQRSEAAARDDAASGSPVLSAAGIPGYNCYRSAPAPPAGAPAPAAGQGRPGVSEPHSPGSGSRAPQQAPSERGSDTDSLLVPLPRAAAPGSWAGRTNVAALARYVVGAGCDLPAEAAAGWDAGHLGAQPLPGECIAAAARAAPRPKSGRAAGAAPRGAARVRAVTPAGAVNVILPGDATVGDLRRAAAEAAGLSDAGQVRRLSPGPREGGVLEERRPLQSCGVDHRATVAVCDSAEDAAQAAGAEGASAAAHEALTQHFLGFPERGAAAAEAAPVAPRRQVSAEPTIRRAESVTVLRRDTFTGLSIGQNDGGKLVVMHPAGNLPFTDHPARGWLLAYYAEKGLREEAREVDLLLSENQGVEERLVRSTEARHGPACVPPYEAHVAAARAAAQRDFKPIGMDSATDLWQDDHTGRQVLSDSTGRFTVLQDDGREVPLSEHPLRRWLVEFFAVRAPARKKTVDALLWQHRWQEEALCHRLQRELGAVAGLALPARGEWPQSGPVRTLRVRGKWAERVPAGGGAPWYENTETGEVLWTPAPGSPFARAGSDGSSSIAPSMLTTESVVSTSSSSGAASAASASSSQRRRKKKEKNSRLMTPRSPMAWGVTADDLDASVMSPPVTDLPRPRAPVQRLAPNPEVAHTMLTLSTQDMPKAATATTATSA